MEDTGERLDVDTMACGEGKEVVEEEEEWDGMRLAEGSLAMVWLWEAESSAMTEEDVLEVLGVGDGKETELKKVGGSWLLLVGGVLLKVLGGAIGEDARVVAWPVEGRVAERVWSTVSLSGAGCVHEISDVTCGNISHF